jgi:hypothetical protein
MRRTLLALTIATAALAACGNVRENPDAPPPPIDAAVTDAPDIDTPDVLPIDAAPPDVPEPLPGQEFNSAAGHLSGTTFQMDVQVGHPVGQNQLQGTTYRLEANTPIKP